jgi:hypothetical protein
MGRWEWLTANGITVAEPDTSYLMPYFASFTQRNPA